MAQTNCKIKFMHKYLLLNVALPVNMLNAKVNYDVIKNLNQN